MMEQATIRIYTYKGKSSKKYYKIAYYKHQFNLVHISKDKLKECKEGKRLKDGRKYLEYTGDFSFDKEGQEIKI